MNSTVLDLLGRALGTAGNDPRRNGLAELAGTWSAKEQGEFDAAVAPLDRVDDDMWA